MNTLSAQPPPEPGFMERYGWDKLMEEALENPERFAYTQEELAEVVVPLQKK